MAKATDRQINYIKRIEAQLGIKAPAESFDSKMRANAFISAHKLKFQSELGRIKKKPSAAQMALVEKLSRELNKGMPRGYKKCAQVCADYIAKHLPNAEPRRPSKSQLRIAEELCIEFKVRPPEGWDVDRGLCSMVINKLSKLKNQKEGNGAKKD